jgi:hypothetical protein
MARASTRASAVAVGVTVVTAPHALPRFLEEVLSVHEGVVTGVDALLSAADTDSLALPRFCAAGLGAVGVHGLTGEWV